MVGTIDTRLLAMLWRRAMILHRVSVPYLRYTEGRGRNREPGESQRQFMMLFLLTRVGTARGAGRICEWASR